MKEYTFYVVVNDKGEFRCHWDSNLTGWDKEFPLATLFYMKDGAQILANRVYGKVREVTVTVKE